MLRALAWLCHVLEAARCAIGEMHGAVFRPLLSASLRNGRGEPVVRMVVPLRSAPRASAVAMAMDLPARARDWPEARMREALRPVALAWAEYAAQRARLARPLEVPAGIEPTLKLRCLGPFEVRISGHLLPCNAFSRRAARSLLMMLALNAGRPVHRDRLAERLWPDTDPDAARNRLHGLIHVLRSAIEPERDHGKGWTFLVSEPSGYRLCSGARTAIDVAEFRQGFAESRAAARAGVSAEERIRILEQVMPLYRGGLFEDEPEAEWCVAERAELAEQATDGMSELARLYGAKGRHPRAVFWLRRALRVDPLREDLHGDLIKALLALGRRAEARRQCVAVRRILREELGSEPRGELLALCRAVETETPHDPP